MSKKISTIATLLMVVVLTLFSTNIVQGQEIEEDTKESGQSLENTGNDLLFPSFKAILSPNISVWTPLGGDDSKVYGMSLKYGVKVMFKTAPRILFEIGISSSPLRVKEDYIRDFVGGTITDFKKSSGGTVNQFFGGIRLLLPSESKNMPYFRIGAGNYKRGDITASYSGRGPYYTFEEDLTIYTEESGFCIYGGFGLMTLLGDRVALDFQANGNLLFLEDEKPLWFEPAVAINILL